MSVLIWVVACTVTAAAATVQGTVGVGFAMVSVPILSLLHPELAPAPQLLVALPMSLAMAWRERGDIDTSGIGWIIIGRLPGAALGAFLLTIASVAFLDAFIGVVVLGGVVVVGTGFHIRRNAVTKATAGLVSGTTGVVSSIGGPPIALLYSSEESRTIRSTLATVFTIGVTMSIFFRWLSGNVTMTDVRVAALLFPAVMIGLAISSGIKDRLPQHHVRIGILVVCAAAATGLLIRAVVG